MNVTMNDWIAKTKIRQEERNEEYDYSHKIHISILLLFTMFLIGRFDFFMIIERTPWTWTRPIITMFVTLCRALSCSMYVMSTSFCVCSSNPYLTLELIVNKRVKNPKSANIPKNNNFDNSVVDNNKGIKNPNIFMFQRRRLCEKNHVALSRTTLLVCTDNIRLKNYCLFPKRTQLRLHSLFFIGISLARVQA